MKASLTLLFGCASAAALTGCATPRAQTPAPPSVFVAADTLGVAATAPAPGWLTDFGAPELDLIAREAIAANPDLAAATARTQASRERSRAVFGRLLPSLDLSGGSTRTEVRNPSGANAVSDSVSAAANASWEADIWGRVRATAASADREADASEADLEGARLSLTGQAARGWVSLIEAQELHALALEDLSTRERALAITQRRYERGLVSALSLRTARSQTASARAGAAQAQENLNDASRRLQALLGRYPDASLRANSAPPTLGPIDAAGAPAALLSRRPDVRAAQARLAAAGFRLHEARASLLPRLSLSARASGDGGQLADAIDPDTLVTQLIAGVAAPLFQGGALRAEVRASEADARAVAAGYVGTALAAWQDVESAITADVSLAIRETELASAAEEAREAQALAEREYERGVATIFELIDAYSRRIDAERGLITSRSARIANRVIYYVALGEPGLDARPVEETGP